MTYFDKSQKNGEFSLKLIRGEVWHTIATIKALRRVFGVTEMGLGMAKNLVDTEKEIRFMKVDERDLVSCAMMYPEGSQ